MRVSMSAAVLGEGRAAGLAAAAGDRGIRDAPVDPAEVVDLLRDASRALSHRVIR